MSQEQGATAGPAAGTNGSARLWIGFAFLLLSLLVVFLDQNVIEVIIPSIVTDLRIDASSAALVMTIYQAVAAGFMILMGKVTDMLGPRRVLLGSMALFILGSLLTGAAWSFAILILGRSLQGLVLAGMLSASLALLNLEFPAGQKSRRALAFALWSAVIGSAGAIGPLIGGAAATLFSWRWAYYLNIPLAVAALLGVRLYVSESENREVRPGFDLLGSILLILGVAALIVGLQEGPHYGWLTPKKALTDGRWPLPISFVPVLLGCGILLLLLFYYAERGKAARNEHVVLNLQLFRIRSFVLGTLTSALMTSSVVGVLLLVPLYAQYVHGENPLRTALILAPLGVGAGIGGPISARLLQHFPARAVAVTSLAIQTASLLMLLPLISPERGGFWLAPVLIAAGAAWGCAYPVLVSLLMVAVPRELSGVAGATASAVRFISSGVSGAVLTAILAGITAATALPMLDRTPELDATQKAKIEAAIQFAAVPHPVVLSSGETVHDLRRERQYNAALRAVEGAMAGATRVALGVAAGLSLLALFFANKLSSASPSAGSLPRASASGSNTT
jgi:EmrB/QacA subfamily drug resistance transporter